jgi:uncharacterized protein (TIGR02271 family)
MTDFTNRNFESWIGTTLVDSDGDKVGKISDIYLDDSTGEPEWLAVNTGLFGSNVSFVPMTDVTMDGDTLTAPYTKAHIKDAPNAEPDGHLSPEEEARLYEHYSIDFGDWDYAGYDDGDVAMGTAADTTATDNAMTRSEEELDVSTQSREAGRARLRKYIVTDHVQTTVPVQREELVVEREPITEANRDAALRGPELTESEHEVVLHEEEVVTSKRTVPKERVRLDKEIVTGEAEVEAEVAKERIDVDRGSGTTGV